MLIFLTALEREFSPKDVINDELILCIKRGDMEALRKLYEASSGNIYGFALSITKNANDAEDVLQDTFLAIHRAAGLYKPKGKPMAWILTITKNLALMKLRDRSKLTDLEEVCEVDEKALERVNAIEDRELIKTLLDTLDSEERQIVVLHASAGLKNREIAKLLDLPLNTVLSKYHRAIKKLQKIATKEDFSK